MLLKKIKVDLYDLYKRRPNDCPAWDAEERLKTVTVGSSTSAYTYNGLGQRVAKNENGANKTYTFETDAIDAPVLSDGAATYVHGQGLLSETRNNIAAFYHPDALGSTRELTSSAQTITDKFETDAFGNTLAASGTTPTPFGFAGQYGYQSDAASGLMMLGYRYYDASAGRFISRDPIWAGTNWYVYANNDPVNLIDPDGLAPGGKKSPIQKAKELGIVAAVYFGLFGNVTGVIKGELTEDGQLAPITLGGQILTGENESTKPKGGDKGTGASGGGDGGSEIRGDGFDWRPVLIGGVVGAGIVVSILQPELAPAVAAGIIRFLTSPIGGELMQSY